MPASSISALVEWIARRERAAVLVALGMTTALAWAWLLAGAGMTMPGMSGWSLMLFAMWVVMMIAMMLPGAAPAILLVAALSRARASNTMLPPVAPFAAGYMLVWASFGTIATAAQLALRQAALVSPALRATSGAFAALLLMAAGVYQFTPLKTACLRQCRSPIQFFTRHWRPGTVGALRLGALHGGYCVGCCWVLMALLFVGGVMNLWCVAAISAFILVEKTAFLGRPAGRMASGAGLVLAGVVALAVT